MLKLKAKVPKLDSAERDRTAKLLSGAIMDHREKEGMVPNHQKIKKFLQIPN